MRTLDEAGLSFRQVHQLFRIAMSATAGVRHNLRAANRTIRLAAELMKRCSSGDLPPGPRPPPDPARLLDVIIAGTDRAEHIIDMGLGFVQKISGNEGVLVVAPESTLKTVCSGHPETVIRSGECEPESLELIYPVAPLFTIMHELVENAVRHSPAPVEVIVSWNMRNNRFACTVEDNGPGISGDLSHSYLPFDALKVRVSQGEGLQELWGILQCSEGLLLFRRSPTLGGTQALFEIPVIGFWSGGVLSKFEDAHES